MANYLVTGAAGFIGAALAKKLLEYGHCVVTIDNLSTGFIENIPEEAVFIEGNCADPEVYKKIPKEKYDAIFHIAGQSSGEVSFDDPIYDIRTNTESTLLLLEFALKNGCSRFIYAGSMSVYGIKPNRAIAESEECIPQSFYGVGKLASEHYMRIYNQYGINSTSLRLFNVYGPGQNLSNSRQGMVSIFVAQMLDNNSINVKGSGERYRDFIYIDDVVHAYISCLNNEFTWGRVINVGTGVRTTVSELIQILNGISGLNLPVKYQGSTSGDIHGIFANNEIMMDLLFQFKPTGLQDGLRKMWLSVIS